MNGSIAKLLGAALTALILAAPAQGEERLLADFSGQDELRWQSVNDDVMGGVSDGSFRQTDRGTLLFAGATSLQNNGGFASIRTRRQSLELNGYDGLEVRVRGDGRTYKATLHSSRAPGWLMYWAELPTVAGQWQVIRIPFSQWVPTAFGRELCVPALRVASINSIGFMIYDKQAGDFSLEVDRIAAYRVLLPPDAQLPMARTDNATARRLIEDAVRRSVPLFNGGDQPACRGIYEDAVRSLLASVAQGLFPDPIEAQLRESLTRPGHDERAIRHAWKLRRALDAAYDHLRSTAAVGSVQ